MPKRRDFAPQPLEDKASPVSTILSSLSLKASFLLIFKFPLISACFDLLFQKMLISPDLDTTLRDPSTSIALRSALMLKTEVFHSSPWHFPLQLLMR